MKATRVHTFVTHRPTLTLQLHNFDLFRTWHTRVSALLRGNWQDFNRHDTSRGPSAIAERCFQRGHLHSSKGDAGDMAPMASTSLQDTVGSKSINN